MNKEFNFDELDKAVNSLVGQADPSPQAMPPAAAVPQAAVSPHIAPSVPPRSVAPVPQRGSVPAVERSSNTPSVQPQPAVVAAIPTPQPTEASPKPAAEKPSIPGRFMDVVHPASNMVTPAKEEARKGMSAEGKTVTPLNNNIIPESLPEKSAANTPNSAQLSVKGEVNPDALITTPDTEEKEWKDPLDEMNKKEQERNIKEGAQERLGLASKEVQESDTPDLEGKKPLFLPDAKVEKRPLGAFAEEDIAKTPKSNGDDSRVVKEEPKNSSAKLTIDGVSDIDNQNKNGEEESIEPLLPELGKEIVAVEAGGAIAEEGEKEEDSKEKSKDSQKNKKQTTVNPSTFSIPKQYKEKAASAEHKPKSIYDTEEYHRSLATASAKKKNGSKWWVWIFIILGLLVLGVGLGAAAFFIVGL